MINLNLNFEILILKLEKNCNENMSFMDLCYLKYAKWIKQQKYA